MLAEVTLIAIGLWSLGKVREQAEHSPLLAYVILAGVSFGVAIGKLAGRTLLWVAISVIASAQIAVWLTTCVCP